MAGLPWSRARPAASVGRFAAAGMRLALTDIVAEPLTRTAAELCAQGGDVIALATDVANPAQVEALTERIYASFGAVHLLCNRAGVVVNGAVGALSAADWQWIPGVNLIGVVNGIRAFVPRMLALSMCL